MALGALATAKPPNVVMIVADDMGYADLGVTGCKDFATPHIDSIARNGVRFTQAYVTAAVCSPSRAGFMTGQYQQRFGHEHNGGGPDPFGMPAHISIMPEHFKASGYKTGMVGKWHLGESPGKHPMDRGFDSFVGHLGGGHPFHAPTDLNDPKQNRILDGHSPAKWDKYLTTYFGERSAEFIRENAGDPFFLYVSFNAPHTPMHERESDMPGLSHIENERRRKYASMMIAMDEAVGMVLDQLKAEGLDQNTLVVFFSDNGGPQPGDPSVNGSRNWPFRSGKAQTYEGGIRVPMLMSLPGVIPARTTYDKAVISLDLLPTFMAAIDKAPIEGTHVDGVNLIPFVTGENIGTPHERLYWRLGAMMALIEGDYKLVHHRREGGLEQDPERVDLSKVQLYNLANDPSEKNNLAQTHSEKLEQMKQTWREWESTLARPLWGTWSERRNQPQTAPANP
jgi:arylsulfatase A-like enzyme